MPQKLPLVASAEVERLCDIGNELDDQAHWAAIESVTNAEIQKSADLPLDLD